MTRTRRLRQNEKMRRLVRENFIDVSDLIYPLFIIEGKGIEEPIEKISVKARLKAHSDETTVVLIADEKLIHVAKRELN